MDTFQFLITDTALTRHPVATELGVGQAANITQPTKSEICVCEYLGSRKAWQSFM
jgi:hypothetical protein